MDDEKQRIEIVNGTKTAIVDSPDYSRIYVDTVEGIKHSDLSVGLGDEFQSVLPEQKYVFFSKVHEGDVYVPIRVKILYEIRNIEKRIQEHRLTKQFIKENAKNLEKNLKGAIAHMKKIEELYTQVLDDERDEYLNTLRVNDGNKAERELARKSYEGILEYTQKTLASMKARYDSEKKEIIQNGVKTISSILKKRKVKNHREEAINLMHFNGLTVTNRY